MKLNRKTITVMSILGLSALATGIIKYHDYSTGQNTGDNAQTIKETLVSEGDKIAFEYVQLQDKSKKGIIWGYVGTFKNSDGKYWCAAYIDGKYLGRILVKDVMDTSSQKFQEIHKKSIDVMAYENELTLLDNTKFPTLKLVSCDSPDTVDWSETAKSYVFHDKGVIGYTNGGINNKSKFSKNKPGSYFDIPFLIDDNQIAYGSLLENIVNGKFTPKIQFPMHSDLLENYSPKEKARG